jgi:hypothetical protein
MSLTTDANERPSEPQSSRLIDWFAEGEEKLVVCGSVTVRVRFISRQGRRGRILIEGPPGTEFTAVGKRPA